MTLVLIKCDCYFRLYKLLPHLEILHLYEDTHFQNFSINGQIPKPLGTLTVHQHAFLPPSILPNVLRPESECSIPTINDGPMLQICCLPITPVL